MLTSSPSVLTYRHLVMKPELTVPGLVLGLVLELDRGVADLLHSSAALLSPTSCLSISPPQDPAVDVIRLLHTHTQFQSQV